MDVTFVIANNSTLSEYYHSSFLLKAVGQETDAETASPAAETNTQDAPTQDAGPPIISASAHVALTTSSFLAFLAFFSLLEKSHNYW